ncbi:MAG: hypothetical protein ACON35_05595 [Candidatus Marinamargulisbacteria bacterium]
MRGYLLILTSGILFFIIAAITIIHLVSSRTLMSQYNNYRLAQETLDFKSIQNIVSTLVAKDSQSIILPDDLIGTYNVVSEFIDSETSNFTITNLVNNRQSTFNIRLVQNQARQSTIDSSAVSVASNTLSGLVISSSVATLHITQIRALWLPQLSTTTVLGYEFGEGDDTVYHQANVGFAVPFNLPVVETNQTHNLSVYFSSLSDHGVISLYFKYSDGSIKNTVIEY